MNKVLAILVLIPLLGSCGKSVKTVSVRKVSSGSALKDKYTGGYTYAEVGGQVRSKSDKTSDFAGKKFTNTPSFGKSSYSRQSYQGSKSWTGTKNYQNKVYGGNTGDSGFKRSSSYANNRSSYSGRMSGVNGRNYEAGKVDRVSASQNSAQRFDKPTSNYGLKQNLEDPLMLGRGAQHGVSLNETRDLMGRKD